MWGARPEIAMSRFADAETEGKSSHLDFEHNTAGVNAPRPSIWSVYWYFLKNNWDIFGIFYAKPDHAYSRKARISVFLASFVVSVSLSAALANNNTKCDMGEECLHSCLKDFPKTDPKAEYTSPPTSCAVTMFYGGNILVSDPIHSYYGKFFLYPFSNSEGFKTCAKVVEKGVTNSDHPCVSYCKTEQNGDPMDQRSLCTDPANHTSSLTHQDIHQKALLCVHSDAYSACDAGNEVARFFWQTVVAGVLLMVTVYIWRFMITYQESPVKPSHACSCCFQCRPSCVRLSGWVFLGVGVFIWFIVIIAVYRESLLNKTHFSSFLGQAATSLIFSYLLSFFLLSATFFLAPRRVAFLSGYRRFFMFEDPIEAVENDLRRVRLPLKLLNTQNVPHNVPGASPYMLSPIDAKPIMGVV